VAEDTFLKPNERLVVAFQEGPVFFKVTGREIVRYEPYEVGVVQAGQVKRNVIPKDANDDIILEPEFNRFIHHVLTGVAPEEAEVLLEFPPRTLRYAVHGAPVAGGPQKWIDGVTSPFNDPNPESELIIFKDLYPAFQVYNAGDEDIYAMLSFKVAKYTYRIIDDENKIEAILDGRKKAKIFTFLEPYPMPNWLKKLTGAELLQFAAKKWNEYMGKGWW